MVKVVTDAIDTYFDFATGGKADGKEPLRNLQLASVIVNFFLCFWPFLCWLLYRENIHVLFWMGEAPLQVLYITPFALFGGDIGIYIIACIKAIPKTAKYLCFALYLINGSVLVGCGLWATKLSWEVSQELESYCGSGLISAKIESEWQRLRRFHETCMEDSGQDDIFIQACPQFEKQFGDERVYIDYIADLEREYECQGFCKFWSKAFFNTEAEDKSRLRCSDALGKTMEGVGETIGVPTICFGLLVTMKGVMLAAYDNL